MDIIAQCERVTESECVVKKRCIKVLHTFLEEHVNMVLVGKRAVYNVTSLPTLFDASWAPQIRRYTAECGIRTNHLLAFVAGSATLKRRFPVYVQPSSTSSINCLMTFESNSTASISFSSFVIAC